MKLRYAKDSDFDFLIEGLQKNRVLENRPKQQFLCFRTDFKVIYVNERFFWVDLIYVKEDHRGKGIGTLLYDDAVKIASKIGYNKIVIDVFDANKNSRKFHRALGFKPIYTIYQKEV